MSAFRIGGFLVLLGLTGLSTAQPGVAWAESPAAAAAASTPQSVTLPTGKTIEAQKFTNPAEGTVEHAILDSMKMIKAGSFDAWITKYCDPGTCHDAKAIESLKTYQLKSSSKTAHECMADDSSIVVTRREANDAEGTTRVYLFCGPNRMPAPASLKQAGAKWTVTSFSW